MNSPPDEVYAVVRDTDPDVLDAEGLADHVGRLAALRTWVDAEQVRSTRAQRRLADQGQAADPRSLLANRGRQSSKDAQTAAEREVVCTSMAGFEEALTAGEVSAGHVDAVAAATRNLDAEQAADFTAEVDSLLGDATRQGVDAFAKNCRDLAKSIRARHNSRAERRGDRSRRARTPVRTTPSSGPRRWLDLGDDARARGHLDPPRWGRVLDGHDQRPSPTVA